MINASEEFVRKLIENRSRENDYACLGRVLDEAYRQASEGKGKERHANDKPFVRQPILEVTRMVGEGGPAFQAMKKIQESMRLPTLEAKKKELLGAINYIAAMILYLEEKEYQCQKAPKD